MIWLMVSAVLQGGYGAESRLTSDVRRMTLTHPGHIPAQLQIETGATAA